MRVDDVSVHNNATHLLNEVCDTIFACGSGPESTGKAIFMQKRDNKVMLYFIQPGKPTQNAFTESFNGRFRENRLNQHWSRPLSKARRIVGDWEAS